MVPLTSGAVGHRTKIVKEVDFFSPAEGGEREVAGTLRPKNVLFHSLIIQI